MRTKPYLRRIDVFSLPGDAVIHFTQFDSAGREQHTRRFCKLSFHAMARLCNAVNHVLFCDGGRIAVSPDGWAFTQYRIPEKVI